MKAPRIQRYPVQSKKLLAAVLAFSGSAGLFVTAAHAQATWTGTVDQDWNNASNWSSSPSNPTGEFTLNLATGNYPILSADSAFSPNNVLLGSGASQTGRFDHRAGSLSQAVVGTNGNWFQVGVNGGTGTYNIADTSGTGGTLTGFAQGSGSLTVGKLWVGGVSGGTAGTGTVNINTSGTINAQSTSLYSNHGGVSIIVGTSGGSGTLNLDNGTVNAAGVVDVGSSFSAGQATQGTLNISGGVFNSEGDFRIAFAGSSSALATVNLTGGTLNVGSTAERWMILGRYDAAKSVVNVSGGNLNLNANTDIRFAQGGTGTHVINLNSGAITSYSGNQTGLGDGVVDMMQGNVAANNTFNLNGGTLTVRRVMSNFSNGTRTFNFNGGTLKATGNATGAGNLSFFHLGTGSARANVRDGGAIIDTNGFNVTIVQALQHSNIGGDNATDGGLTKIGSGTLTLDGANTYTGLTTISAGTLALGASGSVAGGINLGTAGSQGTLDLTAKASNTLFNDISGYGTINVGTGNTVTLAGSFGPGNSAGIVNVTGNLALAAESTTTMEVLGRNGGSPVAGVDFDQSIVSGTVSFGGTFSIDTTGLSGLVAGDSFTLFSAGAYDGNFDSLSIGGAYVASMSYNAGTDIWSGVDNLSNLAFTFNETNGVFAVNAVPEPSTFAAFAGLAGLGFAASRRRRRVAV